MRREGNKIDVSGNTVAELGCGEAAKTTVEGEELGRGEPVVEAEVFGKKTNFAANFYVGNGEAENLRVAAGGFDEAEEHFDGGAFAGAVGAEKAEDFTTANLQRKPADGDLRAELFAKAAGFYGRVIGWRQNVLRQRGARSSRDKALPQSDSWNS